MRRETLLFMLALLCSPLMVRAQVTYDYDHKADFSQYKTVQFLGWQQNTGVLINDLDKRRIRDSFQSELIRKGFLLVDSAADLGLTFFVVFDKKTSRSSYSNYVGGAGGAAWGWGNGAGTTTFNEYDYLVGTFVIDFYDMQSQKLVWQGVSSKAIEDDPKNRDKTMLKDVKEALENFPPKSAMTSETKKKKDKKEKKKNKEKN